VEHDEADIEDLNLAKMDEDPFIYFLTPTPSSYPDDEGNMDFDMDFDAGIEDAKHPPEVVRSISPSSLEGLGRPPARSPTPPRSPGIPDLEYGLSATPDEHENYDYMDNSWPPPSHANPLSFPRRLKDKFKGGSLAPPSPSSPSSSWSSSLSPPSLSPRTSSRGRAAFRSGPNPIAASPTGGSGSGSRTRRSRGTPSRLSPHAWREPSPDVWAIEEEPEEEEMMHGEMGYGSFTEGYGDAGMIVGKAKAVDIPAAKPKKRVRFALPAGDDGRGAY
jgi:hypothetical protein